MWGYEDFEEQSARLWTPCFKYLCFRCGRGDYISHCQLTSLITSTPGCSTPIDVCSVSNNGQLLMFSAGPMSYGFWSDTVLFSQDFPWLGNTRFDVATLRALLTHR